MRKQSFASVGIEYDSLGIRAARVASVGQGKEIKYTVEAFEEALGDYAKEDALVQGLAAMKEKMDASGKNRVVTCISGRQVYVAQVKSRDLPPEDLKKALRSDIRKNLTFDASGSALDYQILEETEPDSKAKPTVMVTAVANALVETQLRLLSRAGITPWVVDVLPAVLANSFWLGRNELRPQIAHLMLHFAPDACTLVIEGGAVPFYSRIIYFGVEEICGPTGCDIAPRDRSQRLDVFVDELKRSLSYYSKTYGVSDFGRLYLIGHHVENKELLSLLGERLGLDPDENPLTKRMQSSVTAAAGKFDLALALALRGTEKA